jgi:hypothetical protein
MPMQRIAKSARPLIGPVEKQGTDHDYSFPQRDNAPDKPVIIMFTTQEHNSVGSRRSYSC